MTLNNKETYIGFGVFASAILLVIYLRFLISPISADAYLAHLFILDVMRVIGAGVVGGFIVGFMITKRVQSGIILGYSCILLAQYIAYLVNALVAFVEFSVLMHATILAYSALGAIGGGLGAHLRNMYKIDFTQMSKKF